MSSRGLFGLSFLLCTAMLAVASYFQFVDHLEPCPLCILQRLFVFIVGIICLLAFIHNTRRYGRSVYATVAAIFSIMGAAISARHVWLQNLPEEHVPSCGPGLNFILENFALNDAISLILRGSGECAEVVWSLMGISIPGWTFVAFVCLTVMSISQFFAKEHRFFT